MSAGEQLDGGRNSLAVFPYFGNSEEAELWHQADSAGVHAHLRHREDMMEMRVEFYRAGGRVCGWIATPPHRRTFQGATMAAGRDLPHDLMQFTIERALDIRAGFWGLLAHGASFASVPGRRPTQEGRVLARQYQAALAQVEGIVNGHAMAWRRGEDTPLRAALDVMYARWLAIGEGESLVLEWAVHPLPETAARPRPARPGRAGRVHRGHRGAA